MASRMALIGCSGPAEGPWTVARGNEVGVRVVHLMDREQVRLDMEIGELQESAFFNQPGLFPWPWGRVDRYRVAKLAETQVKAPTTVEIMLRP